MVSQQVPYQLPDGEFNRLMLSLLSDSPQIERIEALRAVDFSPESFQIQEDIIYFHVPNGLGRAKINNNFFEQKLKVEATTRNWKTVLKLKAIADSLSV